MQEKIMYIENGLKNVYEKELKEWDTVIQQPEEALSQKNKELPKKDRILLQTGTQLATCIAKLKAAQNA